MNGLMEAHHGHAATLSGLGAVRVCEADLKDLDKNLHAFELLVGRISQTVKNAPVKRLHQPWPRGVFESLC